MQEKKEHTVPHKKAPQFVSASATSSAYSVNPDGTHQLTFSALVTELETETMLLEQKPGSENEFQIVGTTFQTGSFKEDRLRVTMSEQHMQELAVLLAGKFGLDGKKTNGGGNV